ncbi:MAG: DDE-type integrase/transposase/recombinase [Actinomycetia bacterium]|nr:DDE-type integrase/transposase/recombinase [Actinomycetes bacterium]
MLIDAARYCRQAVGWRWLVDETYAKVAGRWRYVYRAADEHGQVIDVFVSPRRDTVATRRFFRGALAAHGAPDEIVTDLARALETGDRGADRGRVSQHRPVCEQSRRVPPWSTQGEAQTDAWPQYRPDRVWGGRWSHVHANLCRDHCQLGVEARTPHLRVAAAFDDLAGMI